MILPDRPLLFSKWAANLNPSFSYGYLNFCLHGIWFARYLSATEMNPLCFRREEQEAMKYLSLFTVILLAVGAHAQTSSSGSVNANSNAQAVSSAGQATENISGSAAAQGRDSGVSAAQTTNLSAELTKKIDTKNAKVGDDVVARTTHAAKLSDGTKLPKGTRLLGKVTDVQAKSTEEKASRLAFAFDHAMLSNGQQLPIRAVVMSLTSPISAAAMEGSDDSMSVGPTPVMANSGRASGGLLGGAAGGVARSSGSLVGNTVRGAGSTTGNTLHTVANAGSASANGAGAAVTNVSGQVTNLQGVSFSSDSNASQNTVVQAQGKNFSLASGTQMMLNVSASNQQ